jgi:hypothetical protein
LAGSIQNCFVVAIVIILPIIKWNAKGGVMEFDFLVEVQQSFRAIISRFGFHVVAVNNRECLLVDDGFALSIYYDREGVDVNYIERVKNDWKLYRISGLLVLQRFTQEDSAQYGPPAFGIVDRTRASLRVFASGLENRCADILSGDQAWLMRLKDHDARSCAGESPHAKLKEILSKELPIKEQ